MILMKVIRIGKNTSIPVIYMDQIRQKKKM